MAPEISDYAQPGAIVSIKLRNFMTYDDCTLEKPAPNLNMILGPNGSGKSAIVCAIIVGLAGDVSLTNRASTPANLVQRGRDWGSTTIELYNDKGKNYVVERKIVITNRSGPKLEQRSEWKLNGRSVSKTDVVNLMTKLNIKVDNLCQFLPQDSVAQFVKMSPSDLLTNTLKAAGDNRLVVQHLKLIEYSDDIRQNKRKLEELKESYRHNEVNARRLETEVIRLKEREAMIKKKNICRQKVHYVRYLDSEVQHKAAQEELYTMEEKLKQARENTDPLKRAVEQCKADENDLKKVVENQTRECSQVITRLAQAKEAIEDKKVNCQVEFSKFRQREKQEATREHQLRLRQSELESFECRLNELRDVDYSKELAEIQVKVEELKIQLMETNNERQIMDQSIRNLKGELEQFTSKRERLMALKEKKLQRVQTTRPDSFKVIEWLAKNKDRFKRRIYLPMFCEINVGDLNNSAYLEFVINNADFDAFVCEDADDLKKFTSYARNELKAKISVILIPDKTIDEMEAEFANQRVSIDRFKPVGYLKDFIEAPQSIVRYLYFHCGIHKVPVFREDLEQHDLKSLMNICSKFFVGRKAYSLTKSRYDRESITAIENIREPKHLIYSLDTKALEQTDKKLAEIKLKLEESERLWLEKKKLYEDVDKEWHMAVNKRSEIKAKCDEKVRIETRIKVCQEAIQTLRTDKIDLNLERAKLQESIAKINRETMKDLERMAKNCQDFVMLKKSIYLNTLLCSLATRNYIVAYKRHKAALSESNQLVESIREQKITISNLGKDADRLRLYAEEKIEGFRDKELTRRTKREFDSIEETTTDALEQLIEDLKVRIRNICQDANNTIMREFNRETEELREKQASIAELETKIKQRESAMSEIKKIWLPKLKEVLKVIDEHYQDFMQKLNYGGKVELDHDATNPDDFKSYGIMIMVRYRDDEQLIPLSSTRQSGGERSVATMIYMLALQTKTTVPFRVVDEINQGMDKDNERKVFELLVRTADESSSQYFLVSPKLLSGLSYGDKMQIHIVFNGKNLDYSWASLQDA